MKSFLLTTNQWKLASRINVLASEKEIFVNHTADVDDIEVFASKNQTIAIVLDMEIYDNFRDAVRFLKQLRMKFTGPILIFSNHYNGKQESILLKMGIDDYFATEVTAERIMIRTLAKIKLYQLLSEDHGHPIRKEMYKGFEINLKHFQAKYKGQKLSLTPKEFNLFYYMIRHHNQVLSREQIFKGVWREDRDDGDTFISSRIVDMHVSHVRDKLKALNGNQVHIKTVRGFGYILN